MIHKTVDLRNAKGWFTGPWDSGVPIGLGYANVGIDELHYHTQMYEVYLVAQGTSTAIVNEVAVSLQAGDMLVVEPGEVHTFRGSSADYLHFVIQAPFVAGDKRSFP